MDHKTFVAGLPAETRAELTERSNAAGLRHLAGHGGAILAVGGLIAAGVPGWWALLPVQGILLVFLFSLEHEATHQTPFATAQLNDLVGRACGFVILLPFTWFRYFHFAHHRHTQDPLHDPELLAGAKPESRLGYLKYVSGLPYWAAMASQTAQLAVGRGLAEYLPARVRPRTVFEARWMMVGYAVAGASLFLTPALLWVWLVPALLGQPFLRLYLLAEHGRCPQAADMFDNSRTTYTTRMMRWLAWNMPYHAEHHAMPNVPFHMLPQLNTLTRAHLKRTERGYVRFHRTYLAGLE